MKNCTGKIPVEKSDVFFIKICLSSLQVILRLINQRVMKICCCAADC